MKKPITVLDIEEMAYKNLECFGSPDLSGGIEYDEATDIFYFKDAADNLSLTLPGEILRTLMISMENK